MKNKILLEIAERQANKGIPKPREKSKAQNPSNVQNTNFPDLPTESFLMCYNGEHKDFFQELISKVNEVYSGTRAEIPIRTFGEVQNMHIIKRMALVSTITNNPSLRSANLYPITPTQSEYLLQAGKLTNPEDSWEDLALLLYDTKGENSQEAQVLKESIVQHRTDLGLSQSDLEKKLVVVNAGGEIDSNMIYGVKPIIIPGITQVYPHEILDKIGEDYKFEYGLNGGFPTVSEIGKGNRTLYMPRINNVALCVLYCDEILDLYAWDNCLTDPNSCGRVNFAPQGQAPK